MNINKYIFILVIYLLLSIGAFTQTQPRVYTIIFDGPVNTIYADYIDRVVSKAENDGVNLLVIELNTPGGELNSMNRISTRIMTSTVPIAVYVSPQGAWAGSAGVFVTLSAHIAAMAPSTSIGSAHPVSGSGSNIESDLREKIVNITVVKARTLANRYGRNADWAEKAVRKSVAANEVDAEKLHIIDFTANSVEDLLNKADGRKIALNEKKKITIHTKGAVVTPLEMSLSEKLLLFLVNPYLLTILGLIAIYGILGEIQSPGAILPGVVGGFALLLMLYGTSFMSINALGIALIALAVILFLFDVYAPSHGVLTFGGIIALFFGITILYRNDFGPAPVSPWFTATLTGGMGLLFFFAAGAGIRAQRSPKQTGQEGMIGRFVEVKQQLNPIGQVLYEGSFWNAEAVKGVIEAGSKAKIKHVEGITLFVEPVEPSERMEY